MASMSSTGRSLSEQMGLSADFNSDLKPENILLDYTGHIALCDFGLCKLNMSNEDTTNSESKVSLQKNAS
jgi:tRNA A-37 threonylcarbamoyl transferase component Bud32